MSLWVFRPVAAREAPFRARWGVPLNRPRQLNRSLPPESTSCPSPPFLSPAGSPRCPSEPPENPAGPPSRETRGAPFSPYHRGCPGFARRRPLGGCHPPPSPWPGAPPAPLSGWARCPPRFPTGVLGGNPPLPPGRSPPFSPRGPQRPPFPSPGEKGTAGPPDPRGTVRDSLPPPAPWARFGARRLPKLFYRPSPQGKVVSTSFLCFFFFSFKSYKPFSFRPKINNQKLIFPHETRLTVQLKNSQI